MTDELSTQQAEPVSAPVGTTDFTAEMGKTYDRVQEPETFSRMPNEQELVGLKDHSAYENPTNEPDDIEQLPQPDDIKAPASLNAKAREHWGNLPREMQEYITQRESEAQRRISELGNEAKSVRDLGEVFERYRHIIPQQMPDGREATPHAVVESLLAAGHALQHDPENAIRYLAHHHGVDLGTLTSSQIDPQAIRQQAYAEFQAEQRAAQEQQLAQYISQFASDKPHLSQIEGELLHHVHGLKATSPHLPPQQILQMAYDKALAEHPNLDPKTKERTQTQMREAKRKADEARRQQSLNVRSATGAAPRSSGDMYSKMADIYDQIHGRH